MKKIAILSDADPTDRRSWSGTQYSVYQQLSKYYEIDVYVTDTSWAFRIDRLLFKIITLSHGILRLGLLNSYMSSRKVDKILSKKAYAAAFVFGFENTPFIKNKTKTPILFYIDGTYHQMAGYSFEANRIADKIGEFIQKKCFEHTTVNLAASKWTIKDIIEHYGISEDRCVLCPFGANTEIVETKHEEHSDSINLVFAGTNWTNKGGDIAVECLRVLRQIDKSHKYKLYLIGSVPDYNIEDEDIISYGYLDRKDEKQNQLLISTFSAGDIFILPTKMECAGIVFCEASGYGLPIVTYDTGGIADYVINGYNGFRLQPGSTGEDFAKTILEMLSHPEMMKVMKENGKKLYKDVLNWDVAGKIIHDTIEKISVK